MTDAIMTLDIAAIKARADKAKRYYALYSKTGMHVGLWPDRYTAESLLVQYPQGWIDDLVPVSAIEASETARVKAEQERDALMEQLKMPDADRRQWLLSELVATKGYFNRMDLCEAFGISIPQASTDIRRFLTRFPGLVEYDKTAKRYARSALESKP